MLLVNRDIKNSLRKQLTLYNKMMFSLDDMDGQHTGVTHSHLY